MTLTKAGKALASVGVIQYKKANEYSSYHLVRMNPWNPLSWLFFVAAVPVRILQVGVKETLAEAKTAFKWT